MKFSFERRHLVLGTAFALSGVPFGSAWAGIGLPGAASRRLSFNNIHTGEKLDIEYWADGDYLPQALDNVNYLLRDFRNGEVHVIEPRLLDLLTMLHAKLESAAPFDVISGYRSPATNAMLRAEHPGVAAKSLHMQGMAIDIRLADRGLETLHAAALELQAGGVGYYPGPGFVHVDVGRVRRW